jgi:hypothetical protein
MGAMVGAWWYDAGRRVGGSMGDLELMREISAEVDCRVMAELVAWLRQNR